MDNEQEIAVVREIVAGGVIVEMIPNGSCDSCAAHGICGSGNKDVRHHIITELPLAIGDHVEVYIEPGIRILSSFLVFIFPIIDMVIFYVVAKIVFHLAELPAIGISMLGLLFSGIIIKLVDKKTANRLRFQIVGKVQHESNPE